MITFDGLSENFRFIVLEVQGQLQATRDFMHAPSRKECKRIINRDDHIDNLHTIIENNCFSRIHTDTSLGRSDVNRIRAIHETAVYLERIADHCCDILDQMSYLTDKASLLVSEYDPMFDIIIEAVDSIVPALEDGDLTKALAICRAEHELDIRYKNSFDRILDTAATKKKMRSSFHDNVTSIFIYRYLERMGDALLSIGEALIFSCLGERIKIKQFDALQKTLTSSGFESNISDIDYHSIWGTRSGCRIGHIRQVSDKHADSTTHRRASGHGTIYKEGKLKKIATERRNIERWATLLPELVPTVYGYYEQGSRASLLIEFLQGMTLDEVILTADHTTAKKALHVLQETFTHIWDTTHNAKPSQTDYIKQIRKRLDGVWRVHPEFYRPSMELCGLAIPSSADLLNICEDIEASLPAPYTVMSHGDCNLNNLVYNHDNGTVRLIDLYRSRQYDLVQDISVCMVSAFRMPIFAPELRKRIHWTMAKAFSFTSDYAVTHDDATFQARLALGLARSLYTSPRFELQQPFARDMFLRAHFLLDSLRNHHGAWADFRLPQAVLR